MQYHFTGWDTGTTNIHDNITLTAQYEKNQYTVVWVDWSRKNFEIADYYEGDELVVPSLGERSEERRVGKECRSRWSPYH